MSERGVLIDVSRLVWRFWRGGLPTGIDRVCLAYVEHFRDRARAVIQRGGRYYVFSSKDSDRLFDLFSRGTDTFRGNFVRLGVSAFPAATRMPNGDGQIYLNIGHTGLDEPTLPQWIARNRLRAFFLIHDLIPLIHPEYCREGEHEKHCRRMTNVLASAHGVIGNSKATIDDLASFAAAADHAMPPAVVAWIAGAPVPAAISPRSFDRTHFIIVGTIEGRKNHRLLLHIWQRLVADYGSHAPILVIAGQRGWEANQAIAMLDRAPDLAGHVLELGNCSDVDLANLIAGARALLMPSFAEGFGLPIAEALQLGVPVIASDLPVFREFAGDIPTYLDPVDGRGWRAAIEDFMGDSTERDRQLGAMERYQAPDWGRHFRTVEDWLAAIL